MNPKKDYAEQNFSQDKHSLLLYEFTQIIRAIYPHKHNHNPFEKEIEQLSELLNVKEQLLLKEVIYCITLLNKQSRINNENQLTSTRNDFLNALQLILSKHKRISLKQIDIYRELKKHFQNQSFTYLQAELYLKISHTTFKNHLRPLLAHGLIERAVIKGSTKAHFTLVEKTIVQYDLIAKEEAPFEIMMQDFEDVQGFVDVEYRT